MSLRAVYTDLPLLPVEGNILVLFVRVNFIHVRSEM